jgi:K+-sensing histidine kinase KdpD
MAAPDLPRSDGDADVPDGVTRARDAEGLDIFDDPTHDESAAPARSSRLGVVVLVLAVVLVALDGLAIALLAGDGVTAAASIALVTMLASIAVGVVALVAVATRRGRWPAVAAVLLSVLANPFVFVWLLGRLVPSL